MKKKEIDLEFVVVCLLLLEAPVSLDLGLLQNVPTNDAVASEDVA